MIQSPGHFTVEERQGKLITDSHPEDHATCYIGAASLARLRVYFREHRHSELNKEKPRTYTSSGAKIRNHQFLSFLGSGDLATDTG